MQLTPLKINKKYWHHPSVLALLSNNIGKDPEIIIRELAHRCASEAQSSGWEGPPFCPEILASILGIEVIPAKSELKSEAMIYCRPDQSVVIEYAPPKSESRKRFSIFHEIGHTFFPDCYEQARERHGLTEKIHAELESLCNIAASELMMPKDRFTEDMKTVSSDLAGIMELKDLYNTSLEACAKRWVDLTDDAAAIVFMTYMYKPSEEKYLSSVQNELNIEMAPVAKKLRVEYSKRSKSFKSYIPNKKSAPFRSAAYRCIASPETTQGLEDWGIAGLSPMMVECFELQPIDNSTPRVIALIKSS